MSKATITMIDMEDDQVNVKVEFDPPIDAGTDSFAQKLAVEMLKFAKEYMEDAP